MNRVLREVSLGALVFWLVLARAPGAPLSDWTCYGGDAGGMRYSAHHQIHRGNVSKLGIAWMHRTGELGQKSSAGEKLTFEATPILFRDTLYLSTAFNRVIALDPVTGERQWTFDPGVRRRRDYSEVTSRGVSVWPAGESGTALIFVGTIDARLMALDATTGRPHRGFGRRGTVNLAAGMKLRSPGDYQITSPPAVVRDVVIVGSSIGDNWSADTGDGVVRAFDARTGRLRWSWDPIPRIPGKLGGANAWSVMSAVPVRDLVFIPQGSPSPDFYGGLRPGDNRHANSVVALRASTGELVWAFQTVHHDLWDYDVAAQPVLVTVKRNGESIPAVVQATKMGFLFVLHRETGVPLFPVEERPVPQSKIPGEVSWPTQPVPVAPPPLMPLEALNRDRVWGLNEADRAAVRQLVERHPSQGIYTPPSLEGVVTFPGNGAGINWGSVAFDPGRGLVVANTSRTATMVELLTREEYEEWRERDPDEREGYELGSQAGTPFAMRRKTLLTPSRVPGNPPPWGTLAAVDVNAGMIRWQVPLGGAPDWHPAADQLRQLQIEGIPNGGGPMITAGGLIFIGAAFDNRFRAFDIETGRELWSYELPCSAVATPMTYQASNGRQYVVVCAGGHGKAGVPVGDYVFAFALP
jgi:quinoprotein glucose dehydrogenase